MFVLILTRAKQLSDAKPERESLHRFSNCFTYFLTSQDKVTDFKNFAITSACLNMPLNCRLCGHEKPANELVISLESESDKVTFRDLVEYFMRITLERDASLTQKVCKTCKVSLESFMYFCDHVEKHQKELKKTLLKSKEMVMVSIPKPEIVIETELPDPCSDSGGIDDIGEDSNMSTELTNGYAESTTSRSSNHNLRKRSLSAVPVDLKDCSVVLDRLDIGYVTSDTESEEEVPIEDKITPRKRPFSDGESPPIAKRMRVSPIKSPLVSFKE